jgi:voltage-gated potassium channel
MTGAVTAEPFRRRLFDVLERSRRGDAIASAIDAALIALILANVAGAVVETVPEVKARFGAALSWFDTFCVAVYIVEYAARLWTAPEHPALRDMLAWRARLRHAVQPIMLLDLVAISPFFIAILFGADLPVVRVLRVLRFFRLARYSPVLATIIGVLPAEWRALAGSAVLFAGLILLSGVAMFIAEGDVQPQQLGDVPRAMWFSVVTLSTVGYGDVVPVTLAGKMIAGFTMIIGILFFALPVGIVATSFQEQIRRRDFVVSFAMVARVPLFSRLDAATVARLVGLLTARRVAAGDVIITRGEKAATMYFIASGKVRVDTPAGPVTLAEGDFFGEVALITEGARRNATVTATRTCELLVLSARDFRHLTEANAEIAEAVREVARQRADAHRRKDAETR